MEPVLGIYEQFDLAATQRGMCAHTRMRERRGAMVVTMQVASYEKGNNLGLQCGCSCVA